MVGRPAFRQAALSVQELLSRRSNLRQVSRSLPAQQEWLKWLRAQLPHELAAHIVNVVPKPALIRGAPARTSSSQEVPSGQLLVFADSGAWCTRLRYALGALHEALRERDGAFSCFAVRVARAGVPIPPAGSP